MILILGRAAAGKDALADALAEQGLNVVGRHSDSIDETSPIIKIDDENADIAVVTPEEMNKLCEQNPDKTYHIVYVVASEDSARRTMAELAYDPTDDKAKEKVELREQQENPVFEELENKITESAKEDGKFMFSDQIGTIRVFVNDYQPTSLAETCARIILEERVRKNVLKILHDCAFTFSDIRTDDDNNLITESPNGDPIPTKIEAVANAYTANPEMLGPVMLAWLKHVDLTKMKDVPKYTDDIILQK